MDSKANIGKNAFSVRAQKFVLCSISISKWTTSTTIPTMLAEPPVWAHRSSSVAVWIATPCDRAICTHPQTYQTRKTGFVLEGKGPGWRYE